MGKASSNVMKEDRKQGGRRGTGSTVSSRVKAMWDQ